jgi:hypothetical protein
MQVYLDTVDSNRAALVPDSLNDGNSDPAASLENSAEASSQHSVENSHPESLSSEDDDIPALDIPEQFFNKE